MTSYAPSWVSIDSTYGVLSYSTENVTSNQDYKFYLYSYGIAWTYRISIPKLIILSVRDWPSANWKICSGATLQTWNEWNSGYFLNSGECIASPLLKTWQIIIIVVWGCVFIAIVTNLVLWSK